LISSGNLPVTTSASETTVDRRVGLGVFIVLYDRRHGCVVVDLGKGDVLGLEALSWPVERGDGSAVVSLGPPALVFASQYRGFRWSGFGEQTTSPMNHSQAPIQTLLHLDASASITALRGIRQNLKAI